MPAPEETSFRPEIEGLRAVAVIPIVALHAGLDGLAGGFLGVDVFFVISGYLITRLIVADLRADRFSLVNFYRRRAARLVPALVVMIAVTLIVTWALFLRQDARGVGWAAITAAAFTANLLFWFTTNYFSGNSAQPLLHLWSLGVEEQFYVLAPLALLWAWHRKYRIEFVLISIAIASIVAAVGLSAQFPQAVFYLLPFRAWELALGGLVAFVPLKTVGIRLANTLATSGLALVGSAFLHATSAVDVFVYGTLAACAGTALFIAFGAGTVIARALSFAPMRWIGRISYSVYLWHWPLIALYRLETGVTLDPAETLVLTALSVAVGWLSYIAIERPWNRRGIGLYSAGLMLGTTALAGATMVVMSMHADNREADRIAGYLDYPASPMGKWQFRTDVCWLPAHIDFERCVRPDGARRNILVAGNSYAAHIWRAISDRAPDANVMQATVPGCAAVLDGQGTASCLAAIDRVLRKVAVDNRVAHIVLSHNWQQDSDVRIGNTVRWLRAHGRRVTVIGAPVEYDGAVPRILASNLRRGTGGAINQWQLPGGEAVDRQLRAEVIRAGGNFYSLRDRECTRGVCISTAPDGAPLHFDNGHLTLSGARFLLRELPPL